MKSINYLFMFIFINAAFVSFSFPMMPGEKLVIPTKNVKEGEPTRSIPTEEPAAQIGCIIEQITNPQIFEKQILGTTGQLDNFDLYQLTTQHTFPKPMQVKIDELLQQLGVHEFQQQVLAQYPQASTLMQCLHKGAPSSGPLCVMLYAVLDNFYNALIGPFLSTNGSSQGADGNADLTQTLIKMGIAFGLFAVCYVIKKKTSHVPKMQQAHQTLQQQTRRFPNLHRGDLGQTIIFVPKTEAFDFQRRLQGLAETGITLNYEPAGHTIIEMDVE